jgi:hypothetical protein
MSKDETRKKTINYTKGSKTIRVEKKTLIRGIKFSIGGLN